MTQIFNKVEVDGLSHYSHDAMLHDKKRDGYMQSLGILVKRYTSNQVFDEMESVLQDIFAACLRKNDMEP